MQWYRAGHKQNDTKDSTASFDQAGTRENIKSGEEHKTIFGKIARWFADLKLVAFTGSYNDLTGRPPSFPPSSHKHAKSDITDFPSSMPASDVKAWAKAANKPSYNWSEIGSKPSTFPPASHTHSDYLPAEKRNGDIRSALYYLIVGHNGLDGTTADIFNNYKPYDSSGNLRVPCFLDWTGAKFRSVETEGIDIRFPRFGFMEDTANEKLGTHGHVFVYDYGGKLEIRANVPYTTTSRASGNNSISQYMPLSVEGMGFVSGDTDYRASIGPAQSYQYYHNSTGRPVDTFEGLMFENYIDERSGGSGFRISPHKRDNFIQLGSSSKRFKQIYCGTSVISTSDRDKKKDISYFGSTVCGSTYIDDSTLAGFIMGLKPCVYKFKDNDSDRPHHGLIAQDVEELMEKLGIRDHAAFIKSPRQKEIKTLMEKPEDAPENYTDRYEIKYEDIPGEFDYFLRYEEFTADIIRFCQILYNENQELKERVSRLENKE